MEVILIEGRRNGYSPKQCGRTLTAGELIEALSRFDPKTYVFLDNDNGYTYGNISDYSMDLYNYDEESDTIERY